MEEAQKVGNARRLFQLIRATGPRNTDVMLILNTVKLRRRATLSVIVSQLRRIKIRTNATKIYGLMNKTGEACKPDKMVGTEAQ
ncbi:hypothetical protein T265_02039 [Opisthorchis viverrini]|uniref:Uncharacterized protein n=1 Tax=Opisthorchis viverrini TaxID=6198 RepID=A0A075AIK8_OPIVI|nr:hypothetical protein T265_02039 [Opisthorchis viverrini]KER31809.1 hypothetical protein T265_02039 [Opisthorchis viverrini]